MKNVGAMKMGKRENPEKIHKNPDILHHNCPLATPRLELGTPVGTDERSNSS